MTEKDQLLPPPDSSEGDVTSVDSLLTLRRVSEIDAMEDPKEICDYLKRVKCPGVLDNATAGAYKLRYRLWLYGFLRLALRNSHQLFEGRYIDGMTAGLCYGTKPLDWLRAACRHIGADEGGSSYDLGYRLHCYDLCLAYYGPDGTVKFRKEDCRPTLYDHLCACEPVSVVEEVILWLDAWGS